MCKIYLQPIDSFLTSYRSLFFEFLGNFYMMYWADSRQGTLSNQTTCFTSGPPIWVLFQHDLVELS